VTKEALPVIRYRTRDLTRLLPGTARTMRRMDRISGRSDDMLIIRGVNVFPSQLEEEILKFEHLAPHYQLEVNRRGHLDSLAVRVELKESGLALSHEQRCQICHQLRHRIKSMVGISTDITIVNCGSIPRSEGKPVGYSTCVKRWSAVNSLPDNPAEAFTPSAGNFLCYDS
jgi:phenylacetate-CoA ligase